MFKEVRILVYLGGFMKELISKNWKKILYVITGIFIIVDLFFICTSPATIPQDFLEYGPTVEEDIFDITDDTTDDVANTVVEEIEKPAESGELVGQISEDTGFSPNLVKGLLVFGIALIVILALSNIVDGVGGDKKKK